MIPLSKKLNPIWWFGNESEQQVTDAPWYHPEWPEWRRKFIWNYVRNPLQNFRAFVIGVKDREFDTKVIAGNPSPLVIQRDDVGETGFQITVLKLKKSGINLPFVSYSGDRFVFQLGWQPSTGFFGAKVNIKTGDTD